jgi:hypothetical protein
MDKKQQQSAQTHNSLQAIKPLQIFEVLNKIQNAINTENVLPRK